MQVLLRDYREAPGSYDAVVSVEMIEAVGERYWPTYFAALDRLLAPGGRVGLQSITMPHDRMLATRRDYTWIHKYIFPGGLIPSVQAIERDLAGDTGLRIAERRSLGPHYARTLRALAGALPGQLGPAWRRSASTSTFRRMWEFYLAYCEAGLPRRLPRRAPVRPAAPLTTSSRSISCPDPSPRSSPGSSSACSAAPLPVRIRAWDGSEAGAADRARRA